jgi:hypothetical protein
VKFKLISILAAGLVFTAPAFATPVTLDFEGIPSFTSVGNTYGNVSFGGGAQALANDELGTYFSNNPSGSTVMTAFDADATMNAGEGVGFLDAVSFYFAALTDTTVSIWSDLNGTGSILGAFNLSANQGSCGSSDAALCHWDLASVSFSGVAHSVTFGDAAGDALFDNVTVNPVPLPAAVWLMISALGGLALARRKRAGA